MAARPPKLLGFEEVKLWDVASKQERSLWGLRGARRDVGWYGRIQPAVFSSDGKLLAVPAGKELATVWNAKTGQALHELPADPSYRQSIQALAFLPGGEELIAADDHDIKIWTLNTGAIRQVFRHQCASVAFTSDGRLCAGSPYGEPTEDHGIAIYDTRAGQEQLRIQTTVVWWPIFSPDGKRLATIHSTDSGNAISYTIRLWDVKTGAELLHIPGSAPLVFSPDGAVLGTWGENRSEIVLHTIATGGREIIHHDFRELTSLAFSPDGRVLASAGLRRKPRTRGFQEVEPAEGIITLWDTKTGERQADLIGHTVPVQVLAFSPDGRQLVSAGCQYQLDPADTNWIAPHGFDDEARPIWLGPVVCAGVVALLAILVCWQCFRLLRAKHQPRTARPKA